MTWREPERAPPGLRSSWRERGLALKDVWGVAALFLFVMGGIYGGLFPATEGAGMGAAGAMVFALGRGALTLKTLYDALLESARTTAMLFLILIGALMRSEEHTSELQSRPHLVCRLLLEKIKNLPIRDLHTHILYLRLI